jgi:LPXTG-motif cell wall-anchored protein
MKRLLISALAVLVLLGFSGGVARADHSPATVVTLNEQNGSGQNGTATFTLDHDETTLTVEINLSNGSSVPQPAHIHIGSCENLDPKPFYPLNNVVDGKSVTVITEASVRDLDYEVSNQFAVNVHKSAAEVQVYVACGNIHEATPVEVVGMPRTGAGDMLPALALAAFALIATGSLLVRRRSS